MKNEKIKNKNFNYFKWRFYQDCILQSLCGGRSIGLTTAAIGNIASHKWWVSLLCGLLTFFRSAAFLGWELWPSDKQVARYLDKELRLQEKIATMIELKDQEGLIIDKQREDAVQVLSKCEAPRRRWWQVVITPLALSLAFFIASCFRPLFSQGGNKDNISPSTPAITEVAPPFNEALEDIENKISNELENNSDDDYRDDLISQGKEDIDDLVNNTNSKEEIGDELMKSNDDALKALGEAIKNGDLDKITEAFDQLQQELNSLSGQDLADKLHQIADEIRKALENSSIAEDDPLRKALQDLADKLDKAANELESNLKDGKDTSDQTKEDVDNDLNQSQEEVQDAINQQNKNQEAGENAKDQLNQLGSGDDDKPSTGANGDPSSSKGNGIQQGKGQGNEPGKTGGSGDVDYAGNDHVFTDEGDTAYGDVIDASNGAAQNDCDNYGSDEINTAVDDYFKNLYGNNNP